MSDLGSAIGAIGTIIGSAMASSNASEISSATLANNLQMQREQNAFNVQMWNATNEYNTPANQVKRLIEAGFNPNSFAQSATSGNASSSPQSVTPPYQPINTDSAQIMSNGISNAVNSYISGIQADALIKKANAESNNIITLTPYQANVLEAEYGNKIANTRLSEEQIHQLALNSAKERELKDVQIKLGNVQTLKTISEKEYQELQNKWLPQLNSAQLHNIRSGAYLNAAQVDRIRTLLPAELKKLGSEINVLAAQAGEIITDTRIKGYDLKEKAWRTAIEQRTGYRGNSSVLSGVYDVLAAAIYNTDIGPNIDNHILGPIDNYISKAIKWASSPSHANP